MTQAAVPGREGRYGSAGRTRALVVLFAGLALVLFAWAKWTPYWFKVPEVAASGHLGESAIGDGASPAPVSLAAGLDFVKTYVLDVWPAIVAGLMVAAGAQTLLPRGMLLRAFAGTTGSALASPGRAVLAGMPMMLCTCCAAPLAVVMRRCRVPVRAVLAYWLSTPLLNPVVLIFAAVVLSPAWMGLRLGLGALVALLATWLATRTVEPTGVAGTEAETDKVPTVDAPAGLGAFVKTLSGLSVRLLPEYLLLVFALGAVRGALFPLGSDLATWGILAAMLLAVAGTMLAVPTGGEIAVVAALLAAGFPAWLAAALLVTLPAVSLPSLSMVARSFPRSVIIIVPLVVAAGGMLTSGAVWAIGM